MGFFDELLPSLRGPVLRAPDPLQPAPLGLAGSSRVGEGERDFRRSLRQGSTTDNTSERDLRRLIRNPPASLSDLGRLPIFENPTGTTFVEANRQVSPFADLFGDLELGQHMAGLSIGDEESLFALARILLGTPLNDFAGGLLSSNPFVKVETGLTDEQLRKNRRESRDDLRQ